MNQVLLGALDWQHPKWKEGYYPDDLPTDWRLSYYANQFQTVLIDLNEYTDETLRDSLMEALEECHENFRPVLHANTENLSHAEVKDWLDALRAIEIQPAGMIIYGKIHESESTRWSEVLQGLQLAAYVTDSESENCFTVNRQTLPELVPIFVPPQQTSMSTWLVILDGERTDRELAQDIQQALQSRLDGVQQVFLVEKGYDEIERLYKLESLFGLLGA